VAHGSVVEALQRRERALMRPAPSVLMQSGLFDGRALRAQAARTRAADMLVEASEERLESLASSQALTTAIDLSAILIAPAHFAALKGCATTRPPSGGSDRR
jgi:hypothetical protein